MPWKRKRSGPGFNRDASSDSTSAFKRSKPGYNQVYRLASKNICGPGIFVTCVQGKERKAALQFIDLLNETADRIYPGVATESLNDGADAREDDDDQDMDAMRNGVASESSVLSSRTKEEAESPAQHPVQEKGGEPERVMKEDKAEDDIAAQIAAELKDIKATERPRRGGSSKVAAPRFKSVETDTECFLFISVSRPFDPYLLVYTILSEVQVSGEPRTRFVQRLTPVTTTCPANPSDLTSLARTILPTFFSSNPDQGKTFKIDPRIRSHSKLKRNDVIQIVASQIPTSEPAEDGQSKRIHNANLGNPDLWIVVEVVKNSAAISVLEDYERFKKMNLQSVALAANEKKAELHEADKDQGLREGRIAASLVAKSSAVDKNHVEVAMPTEAGQGVGEIAAAVTPQLEDGASQEPKQDNESQISNFRLF